MNSLLSSWFVTGTSHARGSLIRKLCLQPQHLGKGEGDQVVSKLITFHRIGFKTNNHDPIIFKFLLEWQYYHLYQFQFLQFHRGAGTTSGPTSGGSVHTLQDWLKNWAHDSRVFRGWYIMDGFCIAETTCSPAWEVYLCQDFRHCRAIKQRQSVGTAIMLQIFGSTCLVSSLHES